MTDSSSFATIKLPPDVIEIAPDGSAVRPLLGLAGGTMAHFELSAGATSRALAHRTVDEVWFVLSGRGELWRKRGVHEEVILLEPDVCATLPRGTQFQFRAIGTNELHLLIATMPPWPGAHEALPVVGYWDAS